MRYLLIILSTVVVLSFLVVSGCKQKPKEEAKPPAVTQPAPEKAAPEKAAPEKAAPEKAAPEKPAEGGGYGGK